MSEMAEQIGKLRGGRKLSGGIPRLQELSFLEVSLLGVARGKSFEEIRKSLVAHMIALREASPATGNTATFRIAIDNPKRYVRNVTEALKELMRLGLVAPATLPSSASAARSYTNTTFALTEEGQDLALLFQNDVRAGYDRLLGMLWAVHPQLVGFIHSIGNEALVIPLAQWGELPEPRTRERYVDFIAERATLHIQRESTGWIASKTEIRDSIRTYLEARHTSAEARGKVSPYPRNQDFVNACEEALVKFVFGKCGTPIDYISHEVLRRWTRDLGIANFSYHVPQANALRFWQCAELKFDGAFLQVRRRVGHEYLDQVLSYLAEAFDRTRQFEESRSLWVPIHRVRAETCFRLRLPDAVFDRALIDFLAGVRGGDLPFRVNVDPALYGPIPPTELPLRVQTSRGVRTYYSMSIVPIRSNKANDSKHRGD